LKTTEAHHHHVLVLKDIMIPETMKPSVNHVIINAHLALTEILVTFVPMLEKEITVIAQLEHTMMELATQFVKLVTLNVPLVIWTFVLLVLKEETQQTFQTVTVLPTNTYTKTNVTIVTINVPHVTHQLLIAQNVLTLTEFHWPVNVMLDFMMMENQLNVSHVLTDVTLVMEPPMLVSNVMMEESMPQPVLAQMDFSMTESIPNVLDVHTNVYLVKKTQKTVYFVPVTELKNQNVVVLKDSITLKDKPNVKLVTPNAKLAQNTQIVTEENVHQTETKILGQLVIAHLDGTKTLNWHAHNVTLNVEPVSTQLITVKLVPKTESMPHFVAAHTELTKMVMLSALIVTHNVKLV
jgi:hypothetical protein